MASFYVALTELKTVLADGLQDFCSQRWSKLPTVTVSYRKRAEITLDEFPLVLITRPGVENMDDVMGIHQADHTVLLYAGFCENDREAATRAVIELEEEIGAIIRGNRQLGGLLVDMEITASNSDEGNFHPVYFQVLEIKAKFRSPT